MSVLADILGWPIDMYEPVLLGICFPFLSFQLWQFQGTPKMFSMAQELRGVFKEDELDAGPVLRKFWKVCHRMHALQEDVMSRFDSCGSRSITSPSGFNHHTLPTSDIRGRDIP